MTWSNRIIFIPAAGWKLRVEKLLPLHIMRLYGFPYSFQTRSTPSHLHSNPVSSKWNHLFRRRQYLHIFLFPSLRFSFYSWTLIPIPVFRFLRFISFHKLTHGLRNVFVAWIFFTMNNIFQFVSWSKAAQGNSNVRGGQQEESPRSARSCGQLAIRRSWAVVAAGGCRNHMREPPMEPKTWAQASFF